MAKAKKQNQNEDQDFDEEHQPLAQRIRGEPKRVIIVLERACLEVVKSKKGYDLLTCNPNHLGLLKKMNREYTNVRPDIVHQTLMTLLDSPLNKSGNLQVYIHTTKNALIEVSPHLRIPRQFNRFCGLMVQLLHKLKIRAAGENKTLLKVIKNPITRHLPVGCRKIGTSVKGRLIDAHDLVPTLPEEPVCFVFGSHASGPVEADYVEETYSFSKYPLSASVAVSKITNAYERHLGIL